MTAKQTRMKMSTFQDKLFLNRNKSWLQKDLIGAVIAAVPRIEGDNLSEEDGEEGEADEIMLDDEESETDENM
jgi:hypothetical protein